MTISTAQFLINFESSNNKLHWHNLCSLVHNLSIEAHKRVVGSMEADMHWFWFHSVNNRCQLEATHVQRQPQFIHYVCFYIVLSHSLYIVSSYVGFHEIIVKNIYFQDIKLTVAKLIKNKHVYPRNSFHLNIAIVWFMSDSIQLEMSYIEQLSVLLNQDQLTYQSKWYSLESFV